MVLDSETVFNLENVDSAQGKIANRWQESARLAKWVEGFPGPKILAGDFNLAVDSPIYGRYWASYRNAFDYTGYGFGHTKDTKINIFRYPSRIDHILSTPEFRPLRCWTGPDLGSDHLPLIADFVAQ
jgi:endonuclease/exonuclease/phosphatase (EEP) superfamily protein YafD